MTRHRLVVFGGLVAAMCFAADAWSQNSPQRESLLGLLGRSWSDSRQTTGQSAEQTRRESSASADSRTQSTTSHGLLPKLDLDPLGLLPSNVFSRGSSQPAHPARRSPQPVQRQPLSVAQPSPRTETAPVRTAARPRAGSALSGETFHDGFTLPGLSSPVATSADRLPQRTHSAADDRSDVDGDYPVIHPDGRVSVSRVDEARSSAPPADDQPTRLSPDSRRLIQFDSNELRRELVGSYPVGDEARSPEPDITPIVEATPEPEPEPIDDQVTAAPAPIEDVAPITLPTTPQLVRPRVEPIVVAVPSESHAPARVGPRAAAEAFSPPTEPAATAPRLSGATLVPSTPRDRRASEPDHAWAQTVITDEAGPDVLVSNQTPLIASDILGPKQILIGREASYRVRLHNDGDVPANELVASIRIPSWADVVDTTASRGMIQQSQDNRTPGALEWQIQRLDAHASETLSLKLVPRASRPLELGVTWTCAPVGSRAVVEVQEPKLRMHISGPDEVLFDKPQIYRLTLTNPGTGTAENVKIDLLPPGGGEDAVSTHRLGDLPPGTSQSVEVELTAREAGKLYVKALASADGGLSSDAAKDIFCRKPELDVDWRGPDSKYAGTAATYYFRVRNPGTATADDVSVVVALPEGMEFTSASEGQMFAPERHTVTWRVGSLGPGDDYYMELKGTLRTPGANQLRVSAETAGGELSDSKLAETNVVALADLTLDVSDPRGPVAIGADAIYEIRIANRGANSAENINVVALFSEGIEPETVEGAMYSASDGRVTFRSIDKLDAGRQIVLRIHAKGTQPGNHVFRAEVLCKDLDTRLAEEETTRFFADELVDGVDQPQQHADQQPSPSEDRADAYDRAAAEPWTDAGIESATR